jgi:hypothetical protein
MLRLLTIGRLQVLNLKKLRLLLLHLRLRLLLLLLLQQLERRLPLLGRRVVSITMQQ